MVQDISEPVTKINLHILLTCIRVTKEILIKFDVKSEMDVNLKKMK